MRSLRITAGAAVLYALLLGLPLAAHASLLKPAGVVQTAQGTSAMTSADLDGDGHLDLIVANADQGTVSIFYGDGRGRFPSRQDLTAGSHPFELAVGDMNGDGALDLAVGNQGDHTVDLLLGLGGRIFKESRVVSVGPDLRALAFRPKVIGADLLVARDQAVEVLTLQPDGEIRSSAYPFGAGFGEVLFGDFDGDGVLDLLGVGSVSLALMRGRADGGFDLHQDLFWQNDSGEYLQFWWAAAGDMNGDGIPDVVAGTYHQEQQFVDVGVWSKGATPGVRVSSPDLGLPVAVGDLDGDGHPDMVAVKSHSRGCTVFRGDGLGGLAVEAEYQTGEIPFKAVIGDFDEDGKADVAILNYGSASISLLDHRRALAGPVPSEPTPAQADGPGLIATIVPAPARVSAATRIDLYVPSVTSAQLRIYDAAGRRVADLALGALSAGLHSIEWKARAPGLYFVQLTADGRRAGRTLAVIR